MLRRAAALAAVTALLGLSGCGVSGTDFRPGVAAEVGDERLYTEDVDVAADDTCDYFTERGGGEAFPKSELRGELLRLVVQRAATEQLLAESDVEMPAVPDSAVQAFLDENFPDAAERHDDGLLVIAEGAVAVQAGLVTLGAQLLSEEGTPVDATQQEAALQRGFEALSEWMLDNEVEINPVYGVSLNEDGQLSAEADEISTVVSVEAGYGTLPDQEETPSAEEQKKRQAYLNGLPANQTCG